MSVKDHFRDPARRASRRARFHKQRDLLDAAAAQRIADLTANVGPSVYLGPPRHRETLTTNLLSVAELPPVIYAAEAAILDRSEGRSRMVKEGTYRADWTIRSKTIYSFQPLDQEPLACLVGSEPRAIATAEWADTTDSAVEKAFIHLLNNTLQEQLHADLDWHGDRGYFFFRAPETLRPKKIYSASRVGRTVFRGYYPRKDNPSRFVAGLGCRPDKTVAGRSAQLDGDQLLGLHRVAARHVGRGGPYQRRGGRSIQQRRHQRCRRPASTNPATTRRGRRRRAGLGNPLTGPAEVRAGRSVCAVGDVMVSPRDPDYMVPRSPPRASSPGVSRASSR